MQEKILLFFQENGNPFWDKFFTYVTMLGEQYFILFVISWIFWNYSKRDGFILTYVFLFSSYFNCLVKDFVHSGRPFQVIEGIEGKRVHTAGGYSFPSGHTQGATTLFVSLGLIFRNRTNWIISISLAVLVAVSRVYLGVHWPIDVIGGLVFGILISVILFPFLTRFYQNRNTFFRLIIFSIGFYLLFLFFAMYYNQNITAGQFDLKFYVMITGIVSGSFLGFILEENHFGFVNDAPMWKKILRFFIGVGGSILIIKTTDNVLDENQFFSFFRYFLTGAWISFIFPVIGIYTGLFGRRNKKE